MLIKLREYFIAHNLFWIYVVLTLVSLAFFIKKFLLIRVIVRPHLGLIFTIFIKFIFLVLWFDQRLLVLRDPGIKITIKYKFLKLINE